MRDWLLFNANSANYQIYHSENNLIFILAFRKRRRQSLIVLIDVCDIEYVMSYAI